MATNYHGFDPSVGDDQQALDATFDQHTQSKAYADRLDEKARKWQQLQNKRYGEKRKFGRFERTIVKMVMASDFYYLSS